MMDVKLSSETQKHAPKGLMQMCYPIKPPQPLSTASAGGRGSSRDLNNTV